MSLNEHLRYLERIISIILFCLVSSLLMAQPIEQEADSINNVYIPKRFVRLFSADQLILERLHETTGRRLDGR